MIAGIMNKMCRYVFFTTNNLINQIICINTHTLIIYKKDYVVR